MEKIALGDSGRHTTRLGFGLSGLMGALSRRESLAVLEAAFDTGIRHFDAAPMYGYGEAEGCLGEFLAHHSGDVTVTTKYGIPAPQKSSFIGAARKVAGPIVKRLPGIKQQMLKVANAATRSETKLPFTAAAAKTSLERSLSLLRTEHIDLWLLHEVEASDLQDDGLLRLLEDEVSRGTIGTFGVASESCKMPGLLDSRPAYCRTLQYEWSILDAAISPGPHFRIHHRSLTKNFRLLHAALQSRAEVCRRWSADVGVDLADPDQLARLMLKAALVMNPASVILFSSMKPKHIQENVRTADDTLLDAPVRRLHHLMQTRRDELASNSGSGV